jgi:methylthioribose-1-phosphate isomerase
MTPLIEALTKAADCAGFVVADLRAALASAGPVEAIVIMDRIEAAADGANRIGELLRAVEAKQ